MPSIPHSLASAIARLISENSAPKYTKSPARGRTMEKMGTRTCLRTAGRSSASGVTPPMDRFPQSSMRSAPPRSAASAASRLSTLISSRHFRLTARVSRPQPRASACRGSNSRTFPAARPRSNPTRRAAFLWDYKRGLSKAESHQSKTRARPWPGSS